MGNVLRSWCATLLLAVLSGCGSRGGSRTLSVIPRDVDAPATSEHAGVAGEAARKHLHVYWNGPSYADDVEEQVMLVDRAIRMKSYGLIISPNNPYALNAGLARALSADIPVVVLGAPIPLRHAPGLSFVLSDRSQATEDAAAYLAQRLPPDSEVMIVGLSELSPGNADEARLFVSALQRHARGFNVVQQEPAPFSFGQTELSAERALRAHPRLRAIFALDSGTTTGVLAAVTKMGLVGQIHIIGCDPTMNLLYLLRQGQIDGLVIQNMPRLAEIAVDQIVAQRTGQAAAPQVLVPGLLVTAANVDDAAVQQMLRMDWEARPMKARTIKAIAFICLGVALCGAAVARLLMLRAKPSYRDTFSENKADEWIPLGGAWQLSGDSAINRSDERGAKLLTGSRRWGDYELSADVKLIGHEGDVGLIVRSSDEERGVDAYDGYYVGLRSSDSALVIGRADHGWLEGRPVALQGGVQTGSWYHLRIVAVGCNIGAVATDVSSGLEAYVAMHEDSCPASGGIGLRSMGAGGAWRHVTVKPAKASDWQAIVQHAGEVEAPMYPLRESDYNRMRATYFQSALVPARPFAWRSESEVRPSSEPDQVRPLGEVTTEPSTRVDETVRGVVTLTDPVYIQDQTGSIAVQVKGALLNLGDEVELKGQLGQQDGFRFFKASAFRLLWDRTPVIAASVTSTQAATGSFEASLVDVRGILSAKQVGPDGLITLDMRDAAQSFRAVMRGGLSQKAFRSWQPGSELRLRGICTTSPLFGAPTAQRAESSFYIFLRSVDDVEVLQAPPFWSASRIVQMVLVAMALTVLAAMLWISLESAKHQAVLAERERLAHDMHDTLAQSFAGVGFHLQGVRNSFESGTSDIAGVMKKIEVACDLVTATHREASASIAALHPDADGGLDLLVALERCVHSMLEVDVFPLTLERRGNAQPMSMSTRDLLFQVGREAMTNVLRHSRATQATLLLCFEPKQVCLEIRDDGIGFDPAAKASGFGVRTMQRRCDKIGAVLTVCSTAGSGAVIRICAPYGNGAGIRQRLVTLFRPRMRAPRKTSH